MGLKHISTAEAAWRSLLRFITMLPAERPRQTAECVGAVIMCCEGPLYPQCLSNAVSSPIQLRLATPKTLLIVKSLPKKSQPALADAVPSPAPSGPPESQPPKASRCNRTLIKRRLEVPKRDGRRGQPKRELNGRKRRLRRIR